MFCLASHKLLGRRVLVIADDGDLALAMTETIGYEGGIVLGPTSTIEEALCYIATIGSVDCVMLETRMATSANREIPSLFTDHGVEPVFVIGHDEWFDEDDEDLDECWPTSGPVLAHA